MSSEFLRDIVAVCVKHKAVPSFVLTLDRNLNIFERCEEEIKKHKTVNDVFLELGNEFNLSPKAIDKIYYAVKNSRDKKK